MCKIGPSHADGPPHPYIQAYRSSQAWWIKQTYWNIGQLNLCEACTLNGKNWRRSKLTDTKKFGCGLRIAQNSPCDPNSWAIRLCLYLQSNNKMMNFEEAVFVAVCLYVSYVSLKFWPDQWAVHGHFGLLRK